MKEKLDGCQGSEICGRCARENVARRRYPRQCGEGDVGPKGRNVVLDKNFGAPTITKDGVTVAKEIELEDPFENMGAQMVREVAQQDQRRGRRRHHDGDRPGPGDLSRRRRRTSLPATNPMDLKRGIEKAVEAVDRGHQEAVASQSSRNARSPRSARSPPTTKQTIGKMIAEAMEKVGKDGVITVEEAKTHRDRARGRRGHAVRPWLPVALLRHQCRNAWKRVLEDAYILIHEKKISQHAGPAAPARADRAERASRC